MNDGVIRISRDEVGLLVARAWAFRGTCYRRRVGCLLVDRDGFELSTGYNGPASGEPHCYETPCPGAHLRSGQGLSTCEAIHAEANALLRCRDVREIYTCYSTTSPCVDCVKLLLGTGCRRVVFGDEYPHPTAERKWLRMTEHDKMRGLAPREWIQLNERCHIMIEEGD